MMQIIDGRKLRDDILAKIKEEIKQLSFQPVFCDILVGKDPVSFQYVEMKRKTAEKAGIHFHKAFFNVDITTDELIREIKILNKFPNMCGIIVQLPLPETIDARAVVDAIDPVLDVDCLGSAASQRFYEGHTDLGYPTALACMAMLDAVPINLKEKTVAVLGQGMLVGKPVTALLRFRGIEPVTVNSRTENKEEIIKNADVIISGIGKGKYITGEMIKEGAVLIDAGTSEENNCVVGDVDLENVASKAGYVSPVPGGVGPVTVAMLLNNVLTVAKSLKK